MQGEEIVHVWEVPGINGWVRDGAGGHKGEDMQAVEAPRVVQSPYAPELNPVECFFRKLRRIIEGRVHSGPAGHAGADSEAWQTDPARVRQLCGWSWSREVLTNLSTDTQVIQS